MVWLRARGRKCPLFRAHPLNLFSPTIPSTAAKAPPQLRHYTLQVALTLKTPYRDGTAHIVMSPLEFMQRLAALVPRPRLNLIRFHGVLAPHAARPPQGLPISFPSG